MRHYTKELVVGDTISESPVGHGTVTGFSINGYAEVDGVPVAWCRRSDGLIFNPRGIGAFSNQLYRQGQMPRPARHVQAPSPAQPPSTPAPVAPEPFLSLPEAQPPVAPPPLAAGGGDFAGAGASGSFADASAAESSSSSDSSSSSSGSDSSSDGGGGGGGAGD